MKKYIPAYLQGDGLQTHLVAVALGAVLMMAVGFSWTGYGFGWKLAGTAEQMASTRAENAVNVALAPICAERFLRDASAEDRAAFAKENSYSRGDVVGKVVKFAGESPMSYNQKELCVEKIDQAMKLKSAKS
jgi:hypothetical protein